jgi:sucrose-6-phosphate hydrolase SacC (GH32 family)
MLEPMRFRIMGSCVVGLLLATAIAWGGEPFPAELVEFGPPSAQPLFAGAGPEAWDRDLRERGWIMREGKCWSLWYTGSNPARDPVRRMGLATSTDGLNWTRCGRNPLVRDAWVEDVCVVRHAGRYLMFAEGEHDIAHLLTSVDRVRWKQCGPLEIRRAAGGPIPDGPRGTPAVWFERGVWHLFYERMDDGVWLATSRDGRLFTNVTDEPVLACGPEPYDRHAIAVDQIVRHAGRYYAYYHSSPRADRATWQTCLATSTDLVRWTKYAGNPLLPVDPDAPKRSSATLVHDGERFRLYTTHPDVRVRFGVTVQPAAGY